jgi:hypothetical protein
MFENFIKKIFARILKCVLFETRRIKILIFEILEEQENMSVFSKNFYINF